MSENSSYNILDLILVFLRRKKIVVYIIFIFLTVGIILAFLWPKSYKSEISFIVTDGNAINFSGGGLLNGLANLSASGGNVTAEQTLVLMRSKAIQNQVISEFNLNEVYNTDIQEALRRKLDNNLLVEEKREGGIGLSQIISIKMAFVDSKPERTYEIVKFYYSVLENKVSVLNKKNVEDGYLLLKERLLTNEEDLKIAEDSLVRFQTRYGILEVEEQAKAQISGLANLKSEIVKLEIQIEYMKKINGSESRSVKNLQIQKQEFQNKYDSIFAGGENRLDSFINSKGITEMPKIFLEYLRRYREVVVQEEIYKVLYPQFEQQKLNYEKVSSGLLIIDDALLPTYKDSPKRLYIILVFLILGIFTSVAAIFALEWRNNMIVSGSEEKEKFNEVIISMKKW